MTEPLYLAPNVEALLSSFLRDQPEIVALIPDDDSGARVYTSIPKDAVYPLARVVLLSDAKITNQPLWLVASFVQVDAFGGTKAQAFTLAATIQALFDTRLTGVHPGGVVTGVDHGILGDLPDEEYEPAKPRFLVTSTIYNRPVATLPS